MRTSWWAGLLAVALTCAVAYRHFDQPSLPAALITAPEQAERVPLPQQHVLPPASMDDRRPDEARVQDVDPTPAALVPAPPAPAAPEPAQPPSPQKEARLEGAAAPVTIATAPVTVEPAERTSENQDLSYLHFYAYSEVPPATKPADTVLASLKGIPPGTPIDEIKRVSDLLRLDFTFMKTVAKIESGFDPKERTGSYIGLFQLSQKEFDMYGSGDILDARDNTVAAALKFMTENVMFEMYMHRMPTFNDIYLIHQQGVDGTVEHLSQPRRLAWRSMCATEEGKEKGEKWCKRAIWGNTLPAVKRVWKNVNKVTSADFVRMWRQRVAEFYAQYSKSAAK
jgi:hypothetical protein